MPAFGNSSSEALATAHPDLQRLFRRVVETYDCTVIEGFRPKSVQDLYFRTNRSKLEWPHGKHNSYPSNAVDVAPWPIDWDDKKRFYHFAGYVQAVAEEMDITIRWGGDWDRDYDLNDQNFMDLVHFELVE